MALICIKIIIYLIFQILLLRWNLIWEAPTKIVARIMDTDNCLQMETNFPLLLGIMGTNMAKMNVVIGLFMLQELNTLNLLLIKWKWVFFTIFFFCFWLPSKKNFRLMVVVIIYKYLLGLEMEVIMYFIFIPSMTKKLGHTKLNSCIYFGILTITMLTKKVSKQQLKELDKWKKFEMKYLIFWFP